MKTLINLINDINNEGLRINNLEFTNYHIAVTKHYKKDDNLIVNKIVFNEYDTNTLWNWHKVSTGYLKEDWNSQNHSLKNCFEFFLDLITRLKEEKGITEEQITNKLDLITFTKKGITFQYSHYTDWETINFYLEGQTKLGLDWERLKNSESILNLTNWLTRGF